MNDDDPVVDDPRWLRNEVRRLRGVMKQLYDNDKMLARTEAEQAVLDAAMRWHFLDTSVNAEALHHYCVRLAGS